MSRILLSLLIILSVYSASAQFNKGDILIGGDLSYSNNKLTSPYSPEEQKNNSGIFDISLGKAIKENALFGINLTYGTFSNTSGTGPDRATMTNHDYSIGIFYRAYKSLGKDFYIFGQAGAGYNGSTGSTTDSAGNQLSTSTGNGGSIYVTPGIAYKISKKFFLELSIPQLFSIAYTSSTTKSESVTTGTNDNFGVNANLSSNPLNSLGLGFRLIL